MSKKLLVFLIVLLFAVPAMAQNCDIPYLYEWGFGAIYDGRMSLIGDGVQQPGGGFKIWMAFDGNFVDQMKSVRFKNTNTGMKVKIVPNDGNPYSWFGEQIWEPAVWLGQRSQALGLWKLTVKYADGSKHTTSFELTKDHLNMGKPQFIKDIDFSRNGENEILVTHRLVNGQPASFSGNFVQPFKVYRFRVFGEDGFIYQIKDDGTTSDGGTGKAIIDPDRNTITWVVPSDLSGFGARIEARFISDKVPVFCKPWPGDQYRAATHFKLP